MITRDAAHEGFSATAPGAEDIPVLGRATSNLSGRPPSIMRAMSRRSAPVVITGEQARELAGPPPDGGLEAWLCVAACFLEQFCVFGFSESSGVSPSVKAN